jgi:hypothetical protein
MAKRVAMTTNARLEVCDDLLTPVRVPVDRELVLVTRLRCGPSSHRQRPTTRTAVPHAPDPWIPTARSGRT